MLYSGSGSIIDVKCVLLQLHDFLSSVQTINDMQSNYIPFLLLTFATKLKSMQLYEISEYVLVITIRQ